MGTTEDILRAEIAGWRAALLRRNAELEEARADLVRAGYFKSVSERIATMRAERRGLLDALCELGRAWSERSEVGKEYDQELTHALNTYRAAVRDVDALLAVIEVDALKTPVDPAILSLVHKTPEDTLQLVALCTAGKRAQFDDVDQARAFAAGLDELSCERLVQACAERGRPEAVAARLEAAQRRLTAP